MIRVIDKTLFYMKTVLLLIAFSFVLYISFMKVDYKEMSLITILPVFFPFFGLLILFVIGLAFNKGDDNIFFNITCVTSFLAIIIICLRTLFDQNIIQFATSIAYNYFINCELWIKILLYLLLISNFGLLYYEKNQKINKIHS